MNHFSSRDRARIDVLGTEHASIEEKSSHLLCQLKSGEITISDLMGPLYGQTNLTPAIIIPPGSKELSLSAEDSAFLPTECKHNILLQSHIHPHDYQNPVKEDAYDLVVIGAGVSGLISVIIGAWLGDSNAEQLFSFSFLSIYSSSPISALILHATLILITFYFRTYYVRGLARKLFYSFILFVSVDSNCETKTHLSFFAP